MLTEDDVENFARQYIEDEGHVEYDIVSRCYKESINEWIMEVEVPNKKVSLHTDGIDGRLLLKSTLRVDGMDVD